MKKVILSLVAITAATFSFAQVQFGAKAGLNIANVTGSDANAETFPGKSSLISFHVGALASIPVSEAFSVQPEVLYSGQGADISGDGQSGSFSLGYINVPILAKYTIANGFAVEAGPQIGFLLSGKEKVGSLSQDIKSELNSTDFSVAVGVSYLLTESNIGFDARYNIGLSTVAKEQDGTTPKINNGVIQIGAFYLFGGGKAKK
jgi:hypothetical protein